MKRLHIQLQPARSPALYTDAAVARLQALAAVGGHSRRRRRTVYQHRLQAR